MSEAREAIRAQEEYGQLCAAYVAMTRSRQALYVLTKKLKEDTSAKNFARQLMLTLNPGSDVVPFGKEDWYKGHPIGDEKKAPADRESLPISECTAGTPHPLSPSSLAGKKNHPTEKAAEATHSLDAADLGTEIHEVLSHIEWDAAQVDLSSCSKDARSLIELFLKSSEAKKLFGCPGEGWELWNEKPFDLMIGGKWISGIFDRVHIRKVGGKTVEAKIFDYKTNRSTPEKIAEEYEGQMEQYRQAAAKLLGISPDKVEARTVPIRRVTSNP
jgi:ATP-dependent exoDNAse (exonuclease V) beta subunit